jgi:hypothetical protein
MILANLGLGGLRRSEPPFILLLVGHLTQKGPTQLSEPSLCQSGWIHDTATGYAVLSTAVDLPVAR